MRSRLVTNGVHISPSNVDQWCPLVLLKGDPSHETEVRSFINAENALQHPTTRLAFQEVDLTVSRKSKHIENAQLHHYNVCLLKSDIHGWEMQGSQRESSLKQRES